MATFSCTTEIHNLPVFYNSFQSFVIRKCMGDINRDDLYFFINLQTDNAQDNADVSYFPSNGEV